MVNTGSSALLTAFKSIGLKVGDIVITSNYTFIATLNAIKISGGEPWVFDTCENSYDLNLNLIEENLKYQTFKKGKFYYLKKTEREFIVFALYM